jgi:hypothetical protein
VDVLLIEQNEHDPVKVMVIDDDDNFLPYKNENLVERLVPYLGKYHTPPIAILLSLLLHI